MRRPVAIAERDRERPYKFRPPWKVPALFSRSADRTGRSRAQRPPLGSRRDRPDATRRWLPVGQGIRSAGAGVRGGQTQLSIGPEVGVGR